MMTRGRRRQEVEKTEKSPRSLRFSNCFAAIIMLHSHTKHSSRTSKTHPKTTTRQRMLDVPLAPAAAAGAFPPPLPRTSTTTRSCHPTTPHQARGVHVVHVERTNVRSRKARIGEIDGATVFVSFDVSFFVGCVFPPAHHYCTTTTHTYLTEIITSVRRPTPRRPRGRRRRLHGFLGRGIRRARGSATIHRHACRSLVGTSGRGGLCFHFPFTTPAFFSVPSLQRRPDLSAAGKPAHCQAHG